MRRLRGAILFRIQSPLAALPQGSAFGKGWFFASTQPIALISTAKQTV